ncbi:hypothetical protein K9M47_01650 [Candidatus Gracilibacteria bacterium]|nr:hypothetical protein [Candidatus Gracilibacteria bacterium]MCF7898846.1 hypothetical protein [Candidatus Paceibacterota bacterium]
MTEKIIPKEHERRFVPDMDKLPFSSFLFPAVSIHQGYLEDELMTRVRDECDLSSAKHTYSMTRKTGEGVSRDEDEKEITMKEFYSMWDKAKNCSLSKNRFFVIHDGIKVQVNYYDGKLLGYFQIEVEFDSHEEAVAFIPPVWLGREVTDDSQHGNYSLAKFGKPE